jgi:hypothetical protein
MQTWKTDVRGKKLPDPKDGDDHYIDAGIHYALNNDIFHVKQGVSHG